jgi:microcystin degradation protein MlrC
VPVIVGGFMGSTEEGPFAEVMRYAKSLEGKNGVLSTSAFLVQPHLDLPGMGGGGLVITGNDMDLAVHHATELAQMFWDRRFLLEPPVYAPAEAIAEGLRAESGPVLLLEASDCAGGGAAGDSVWALRGLLEANLREHALSPVVDPEGAAICHRHRVGDEVSLTLGHKIDPRWGEPVAVTARIMRLSDGKFTYSGGIWGGQVGEMGPSAWIRAGNVDILVSSHATYDWADEQFRSMGMDTAGARFIVVKNPMNYRVGYANQYKKAILLDTPGPTTPSLRNVPFQRLQRPFFPKDQDIPGLKPTILRGR